MRKAHITNKKLEECRIQLEGLKARLSGVVSELRDEALRPVGTETSGGPPDVSVHDADLGSRTAQEELAMDLLGTEDQVLGEIQAALGRIAQGTYGRCEECGQPISRARLNAIPYTRHCINCARQMMPAHHS